MNPALQGYLAAVEERLGSPGAVSAAGDEVRAVADLVDGSTQLSLALNDGAVPVASRRAVLDHLLADRVRPEVASLVHQAVTVVPAAELTATFHALAARLTLDASGARDEEVLGRLGSRNRVAGYAAAVFETVGVADLEEIEDQLFRFARTVEGNRGLRHALGDRDLPVAVRQRLAASLLDGKVTTATSVLVAYAIRGGRARDVVATLDHLVESAAKARGWRVARVAAASDVGAEQQTQLGEALAHLTGNPVDLQVTIDPHLLGGVVVQVGDLLVDSSTRHRLVELGEHLRSSEEHYRIPGTPTRRDNTDG